MDWPERYSAALELELSDDEIEAILDLARDIAHATERRFAPLSAYLAGRHVQARVAAGASAIDAVREAQGIAGGLLNE